MMMRSVLVWRGLAVVVAFAGAAAVLAVPGCGGGDGCTVGSEGCTCTGGGACDPGLSCLSNRCVKGAGGGGTADAGPAGGAGGGAGADAGAPPMASVDQVCTDFANKVCERFNTCWSFVVSIVWGSQSACASRVKLECLDGAAAPDSTPVTSAAASACLQVIPSITCEDLIYRKFPAACDFKGTRPNGQVCGSGDQCQSGYCSTGPNICGTCAPLAAAGSACREDEDCQPGLTCEANRCVVPGAGGTGCSQNQPCKIGFYCRGGSCAAQATEPGAACTDAQSCSFPHGLFCNPAVRVCQRIKVAQAGEACGFVNNELIACGANGTCNTPSPQALQGVCGAAAADGTACSPTKECIDPARCVNGLCRLPNARSCN